MTAPVNKLTITKNEEQYKKFLYGTVSSDFHLESDQIRIFLCSTFDDTVAERNYLIKCIYPELKEKSKKSGLDFQVLDLRWGVDETELDNVNTDVCNFEATNCYKNSIGPYFIALLGDRYGARILPGRIDKNEFEEIKKTIDQYKDEIKKTFETSKVTPKSDDTFSKYGSDILKFEATLALNGTNFKIELDNILEKAYVLDKNDINDQKYKLRYTAKVLLDNIKDENGQRVSESIVEDIKKNHQDYFNKSAWTPFDKKVHALLIQGAHYCKTFENNDQRTNNNSKISNFEKKFSCSITEKEINTGMFDHIKDKDQIKNRVVVFLRSFKDDSLVSVNDDDKKKFLAEGEDKELLSDLKTRLEIEFKDCIVNLGPVDFATIKRANEYDALNKIESDTQNNANIVKKEDYIKYLENFGEIFKKRILDMISSLNPIEESLDAYQNDDKNLIKELYNHAHLRSNVLKRFDFRKDECDKIMSYINDDDNKRPFLVSGDSGSGKTSLLAKISQMLAEFGISKYVTIWRFLGTTTSTTDIKDTFSSIIYQIDKLFETGIKNKQLESHRDIRDYFKEILDKVSKTIGNVKLVILIDALEQLKKKDHELDWMLKDLPKGIKIIYSVLQENIKYNIPESDIDAAAATTTTASNDTDPQENSLSTKIKNKLGIKDDSNHLLMKVFEVGIVKQAIVDWLKNSNRTLSKVQETEVKKLVDAHKQGLYPLHVKLIFDIVSDWVSEYESDSRFLNCTTIDECIKYQFRKLEKFNPKFLFRRCMFYLTIFENGISENELEDMMSIDDPLLYNVFVYFEPPIRRFPLFLWSRIKHQLGRYLTTKSIDNKTVISWYHKKFYDVTKSIYVDVNGSIDGEMVITDKVYKDRLLRIVINYFIGTWIDKEKKFKRHKKIVEKGRGLTGAEKRLTSKQDIETTDNNGKLVYNERKLRQFPRIVFELDNVYAKVALLKKHIYYDYDFVRGISIIKDDLFVERANDIWDLYNLFETGVEAKANECIDDKLDEAFLCVDDCE